MKKFLLFCAVFFSIVSSLGFTALFVDWSGKYNFTFVSAMGFYLVYMIFAVLVINDLYKRYTNDKERECYNRKSKRPRQ